MKRDRRVRPTNSIYLNESLEVDLSLRHAYFWTDQQASLEEFSPSHWLLNNARISPSAVVHIAQLMQQDQQQESEEPK